MAPLIDAMSSDELKQNEKYVVDEDAALGTPIIIRQRFYVPFY